VLDRRLPKALPKTLGALAEELRGTAPADDGGLQAARNLAAAGLESMLAELRAGARYLFGDQPRTLAPFLSQHQAQRKVRERRRAKARPKANGPGAPSFA